MEFLNSRSPISKERAMEVAVEQYGFCPDIVDQSKMDRHWAIWQMSCGSPLSGTFGGNYTTREGRKRTNKNNKIPALWEQHLNEFAVLLSDAIPSLKNTDWIIEKSECLFVAQMVPRKEGEPQAGPLTILAFR